MMMIKIPNNIHTELKMLSAEESFKRGMHVTMGAIVQEAVILMVGKKKKKNKAK